MKDPQQKYWERKILRWERSRYSPWFFAYPLSWSVRARMNDATRIIARRAPRDSHILELGCGSGLLAKRLSRHYQNYCGVDIAENAILLAKHRVPKYSFIAADAVKVELPPADLTIFLGLTDWLEEDELKALTEKLSSPAVLFSYTEPTHSPYAVYRTLMDGPARAEAIRARSYTYAAIERFFVENNFTCELLVKPTVVNPGGLVWAQKRLA